MKKKWQRYALIIRAVGVLVIIGLLLVVFYYLKQFYSDKMGFTPAKAVETYFTALSQGNYDEVHRLTTRDSMYDIYGRPITRAEFIGQLKRLTGGEQMPFTSIEATKLIEKDSVRYYRVVLYSSIGGTAGKSELVVQVHRVDGAWQLTYPFPVVLYAG